MDWRTVHQTASRGNLPTPRLEPIATFWTLVGPSGRPFTCTAYEVETGLELRASYDDGDIINTELFRGPDARQRAEAKAEAWRVACVGKGFVSAPEG